MFKVLSVVPKARIERFGVEIPKEIEISFIESPYSDEELIEAAKDVDCIFNTSVDPVSRKVIESLPKLKLIHTEGVAFNGVDLQAATENGVTVCNNQNVNKLSVAEHTVGLMIALLRRISYADRQIKAKNFSKLQLEYRTKGYKELSSRHVGIVGFGAIGREIARLLKPFGCKISYYDAFLPSKEVEEELGVSYLTYEEICKKCNVITYHVPVLPETINMGNMKAFEMMQEETIILNLARGEIINQDDLAQALQNGIIAGAGLDTLMPEPPGDDHVLLNMSQEASDKIIITPHIAGTNDEAFERMQIWAYENMLAVMNGREPKNIVNKKK